MGRRKEGGRKYRQLNRSSGSDSDTNTKSKSPSKSSRCACCSPCSKMKCTIITVAIILPVVIAILVTGKLVTASGPLHAQCNIDWTFDIPCTKVSTMLQGQIKKWTDKSGCANGGEKCLYTLKSVTDKELKATHATPVKGYVDDLTFTFKEGKTASQCPVHGYSTSETWYAVLDYGTNYCNLHNLITGSELDKVAGYTEVTSDSICTQFSSHNCTKY